MGLDISAYGKITKVGTAKNYEEAEERYSSARHVYVYETGYTDRFAPFDEPPVKGLDVYEVSSDCDEIHFRAGSYSGYNWWREELAKLLTGFAPREVYWKGSGKPQGYREKLPLYFLIDFSDSEGFIGPDVASVLAHQMRTHRPTVAGHISLIERYDLFLKAFELAAQGGVVIFR